MNRTFQFFRSCRQQRDWSALVLCVMVAAVAVATVGVLFSQDLRVANLRRFHLATKSYWLWAAHQPVPSMYNFENRTWLSNTVNAEGSFSPDDPTLVCDTINHFPARRITFGNYRMRQFKDHDQVMFFMSSQFRGDRLESLWHVERVRTGDLDPALSDPARSEPAASERLGSERLVVKRIKETLFVDGEND